MISVEERLQELLDQRDGEIADLESQVRKLENEVDQAEGGWSLHRNAEDRSDLPVPRLEIRGEKISDYRAVWKYYIVYQHLVDSFIEIPVGETKISGAMDTFGFLNKEGKINLPFRDGAHIHHDAVHFGLRAFVVVGDIVQELDLSEESDYKHQIQVGKSHRRD